MNSNHSLRTSVLAAVLFALGLLPSAALSNAIELPNVAIQVWAGSNSWSFDAQTLATDSQQVVQNSDGSYSFLNGAFSVPGSWDWTWSNLTVDPDPAVNSVFGFTNTAAFPQTFLVTVDLPIVPIPGGTLMGGSMGGSVSDFSGDGLGGVSTVPGTALYIARIDGVNLGPTAQLHPDPYSTPAFTSGFDSQLIGNVNFGLPGLTVPGPAVASSIGIQNKFTLSPGDITSMTSVFAVRQVPEPSTWVLAMMASVALLWRARKRNGA